MLIGKAKVWLSKCFVERFDYRYRGVVQLVEQRSPKPQDVGLNPTAPAKLVLNKNAAASKTTVAQSIRAR